MEIDKFVINLPSRMDRRCEMEHQLRLVGWEDAHFFAAVRRDELCGFPSAGAHGCFLSHLEVLRRARGRPILIMEDDLNFSNDFPIRWQEALSALPDDWSIFYPGHYNSLPQGLTVLDPNEGMLCAHFMMINRDAVPAIVQGLEAILSRTPGHPDGGPQHVDGAYSTIRKQNPQLKTYIHGPSLGYQRRSRSDISRSKWFDRFSALSPIVATARRAKRYFIGQDIKSSTSPNR
ncbi:glycosyltransferase family 25 protein [Bradyrhizobium lablabi]|uniref:glycosyltransferase family 25 protein n=1 Tax=Bradyrhizobium lablabi TaxID=722472 RepID=UPI001BAC6297|nr:glycosyltransferase family 25 protein [Bradyrhizobium lablabi]MBR0697781.1 glycosyltransferase family 25 protein [Bradyrhizobium lablabi]